MKFMILVYGSQKDYDAMAGAPGQTGTWSAEDFAAIAAFMESFNREIDASGELVETRALDSPVHTRRIALEQGLPVVTDGPYAETQEVLASYWIVDCDSFDRATQLAARLAQAPAPAAIRSRAYADVRPLVESRAELEG